MASKPAKKPQSEDTGKSSPSTIDVKNPVTGELIGVVPKTDQKTIAHVFEQAQDAFPRWAALSVAQRGQMLRKWGDLMWAEQNRVMRMIRDETGKNDTGAFLELIGLDNTLNYYIPQAPKLLAPQRRPSLFPIIQRSRVFFKPHGVVGIISPWNYPLFLALGDAVPALLAGNVIVLKPSEFTPFTAMVAVDLMMQAGIPQNVVQIVTGDGTTGKALIDLADYVCFTGSTATGRKVAVQAAERLIPYSLELGGKDPMIVLEDANLDIASASAIMNACENAGQMCISTERVYVAEKIYDEYVGRVVDYAKSLTMGAGDGLDVHMGSMTTERELLRTEAHIQDALNKGAELVFGGKRRPELGPLFIEPAVLIHVDHSMMVMKDETFGPIVPIMKVSNEQEAIRLANDSEYGLSASIYTRDLARGERLAVQLETGSVTINRGSAGVAASIALPWGGDKASGVGRRGGPEGLYRFTKAQSVFTDTLIGTQASLTLLDPLTLFGVKAMRVVRRFVSDI
ncbi:MAG: succinic semialdehyde dehydrogenase [Phototrophicales bacterium]|nr:succinic semialdehyde dehydrogenase [Phototrophicales bacterium]